MGCGCRGNSEEKKIDRYAYLTPAQLDIKRKLAEEAKKIAEGKKNEKPPVDSGDSKCQ